MSRCYPYPPPGYDKKANVELALSIKKEKHKHKDKKKKRRKDSENGGLPRDPDRRSKRSDQGVNNQDRSLENGSLPERKVGSSDLLHENAYQRLRTGSANAEMLCAGVHARNGNGNDMLSKGRQELLLVPHKVAHDSNGSLTCVASPSSSLQVKVSEEEPTQYTVRIQNDWSPIDNQEWLFHHRNVQKRAKADDSNPPLALAEAVFLPSVGIYALPYVVPD